MKTRFMKILLPAVLLLSLIALTGCAPRATNSTGRVNIAAASPLPTTASPIPTSAPASPGIARSAAGDINQQIAAIQQGIAQARGGLSGSEGDPSK